jgi:phosphomannomutase
VTVDKINCLDNIPMRKYFSNVNKRYMTILLFDVDGTLTPSGNQIKSEMINIIDELSTKSYVKLGIVGGGSYEKIKWQLGDTIDKFKYIFSECGAVTYVDKMLVLDKNMIEYCDRNALNLIIKKALNEISKMPIIYHGHQIEFRKGLVYVSPPGMQATDYERNIFIELDNKLDIRKKLINILSELDRKSQFEITLGGAVGIAICPNGWNKSQVMKYFDENSVDDQIYYFGDKTGPDGNDYPLYSHPYINGISVIDYMDTIDKITKILKLAKKN